MQTWLLRSFSGRSNNKASGDPLCPLDISLLVLLACFDPLYLLLFCYYSSGIACHR